MKLGNKILGLREIWQFDNRWALVAARVFKPGQSVNVYRIRDLEVVVDHAAGDASGARHVLTSPMYRKFLTLLRTSKPISVLDIGANTGGFPLLLKLEGFDIRTLVAVEFNPATFSRLETNIKTNFTGKCELHNVAVCGASRPIRVLPSGSSTSDSIYAGVGSPVGEVVSGVTLDELFARTLEVDVVDVCKMDIEGAEFEVFRSSTCESIRRCKNLIIEIHHSPDSPREQVIDKLVEHGFEELEGVGGLEDSRHHVHFFRNVRLP
jgi:FkbM family methyltransferase